MWLKIIVTAKINNICFKKVCWQVIIESRKPIFKESWLVNTWQQCAIKLEKIKNQTSEDKKNQTSKDQKNQTSKDQKHFAHLPIPSFISPLHFCYHVTDLNSLFLKSNFHFENVLKGAIEVPYVNVCLGQHAYECESVFHHASGSVRRHASEIVQYPAAYERAQ